MSKKFERIVWTVLFVACMAYMVSGCSKKVEDIIPELKPEKKVEKEYAKEDSKVIPVDASLEEAKKEQERVAGKEKSDKPGKDELMKKRVNKPIGKTYKMEGQYNAENYSMQWEAVTYTVGTWEKDRDCLWNIARKMLGDPFLWTELFEANKNQIEVPDLIYPGQILVIPMPE